MYMLVKNYNCREGLLQIQVDILHSENMVPYVNMKKLQKIDLHT